MQCYPSLDHVGLEFFALLRSGRLVSPAEFASIIGPIAVANMRRTDFLYTLLQKPRIGLAGLEMITGKVERQKPSRAAKETDGEKPYPQMVRFSKSRALSANSALARRARAHRQPTYIFAVN